MKRLALAAALITTTSGSLHGGQIDASLEGVLQNAAPDAVISTLVYVTGAEDLDALTLQMDQQHATLTDRHEVVVRALRETAAATQVDLVAHLTELAGAGRVDEFESFWISNVIRIDATPAEIVAIADRDDVERAFPNFEIELMAPIDDFRAAPDGGGPVTGGPEPGVLAVNAPAAWALGYTGEGQLVATLDTGVDGNHPALADRWRGAADPRYAGNPEWAWFDPVGAGTSFPTAFGNHGTHTMGSVVGGAPGDQIGVAPGAQWIHAAVIDRVSIDQTISDAMLAFQWMIDPDGDPATNWDVPGSCSNSWRLATFHGFEDCWDAFWSFLDACEAAGIVIIFSAGNEGPGATTIGKPPDRATDEYRTFSVGAIDAEESSWPIANFSSRGPVFCTVDQSQAIKPEISAPGVDVRSSVPGGGYGSLSGTSMASPHVNGVVALMRQANPNLGVNQIKQIIFDTATDLGVFLPGNDNTYGYGMINAGAAVQAAIEAGAIPADIDMDGDVDFADLVALLANWGPCGGECPEDLDGDGSVGFSDLVSLLAAWT